MPDRPGRRKAVFAPTEARHDRAVESGSRPREVTVAEKRRDGEGGQPQGAESRRSGEAEPSAAERRARALRDNLHRRKAQARARKAGPDGESPSEG